MQAMNAEGRTFKGCLYFGLMLTPNGPKVIEYNCRFGDPETQVVLPLLKSDLFDIFRAVENETLAETPVEFADAAACCVMIASGGYPTSYKKGMEIDFGAVAEKDVRLYHSGTAVQGDKLVTAGGRVLGVTATAADLESALAKAYDAVSEINFEGAFYRKDIGQKALALTKGSK